jgi:hypothetical protein
LRSSVLWSLFDVAGRLGLRRFINVAIFIVQILVKNSLLLFLIPRSRWSGFFKCHFVITLDVIYDIVWVLLKIGAIPHRGLTQQTRV